MTLHGSATGEYPAELTPAAADLIRTTWAELAGLRREAAGLFLARLGELDPILADAAAEVSPDRQEVAMDVVAAAVAALPDADAASVRLSPLAAAARVVGLAPLHSRLIAASVLWTLEEGLGQALTAEARRAWAQFCARFAGTLAEPDPNPDER
ncbi:MAG TPA: hypothetical protein VF862_02160 [Gemmatimonadales bacterium]